jgi:single-strand DNA-binding protein
MSFNQIEIYGFLGKDPELRYTPQGDAVCSFSIASNCKRRGEDVTTWFKVTCWRATAENCSKYLAKGRAVIVHGELTVDEWTDRDGNNRFTLDVQASRVHFVSDGSGQRREEEDGDYANGRGDAWEPPQKDVYPTEPGSGYKPPQQISTAYAERQAAIADTKGQRPKYDDDIPF